jgi:hypothetical protein
MQGMQQVDTWDLLTVVPVLQANQGVTVTPQEPFVVQAGFNANGWFYETKQSGTPTAFRSENFGFST